MFGLQHPTPTHPLALYLGLPLVSLLLGGTMTIASAADFVAKPRAGIAGALLPEERKLWKYDNASSQYATVDGDASGAYEVNLRALPEGTKIGFAEGWAAIPFSHLINKRLYELSEEMGFEIAYCDNAFDAEKAVACAELIVQQEPDFVIESNWQSGASDAVMRIFNEAAIPVVSIDVVHTNAIFLGADNYQSGFVGGEGAAAHAKAMGRCDDTTILVGINPGEGEAANERLSGFIDGVQTVCGAIPPDRIAEILLDAGTTDQGLTKGTDWLTANPGAGFVLSTTIDDPRSAGVAKALAQSDREGVAVGLGCDDIGIGTTREPLEKSHFLGCVAYYPEKYPDLALTIAADILEGKAVPQEIHMNHEFLDAATIDKVYPAE